MKSTRILQTGLLSLALLAAGCAGGQSSSLTERIGSLSSKSSSKEVIDTFNAILKATGDAADYSFENSVTSASRKPALDCDGSFYMESQDQSVIWNFSVYGQKLYEVMRSGAQETNATVCDPQEETSLSQSGKPFVGLVEAGVDSTGGLFAALVDGESWDGDSLTLIYDTAIPFQEGDADKYSAPQIDGYLKNTELQLLTPMFGSELPITPYSNPEYFTFQLEPAEEGYILTMLPEDMNRYNEAVADVRARAEEEAAKAAEENGQTAQEPAVKKEKPEVKSASVQIFLSSEGLLQGAETVYEEAFTYQGKEETETRFSSNTVRPARSEELDTQLQELFNRVKDGSLKEKDTFTLQFPAAQD